MADEVKHENTISKEDIEKNKGMAIVSYLGLIGLIVVLLTNSHTTSPYVKFHLNQAVPLMIASLVGVIPIIGWIVGIGVFVLWIMGIINAASGKVERLPIVGNFELIK